MRCRNFCDVRGIDEVRNSVNDVINCPGGFDTDLLRDSGAESARIINTHLEAIITAIRELTPSRGNRGAKGGRRGRSRRVATWLILTRRVDGGLQRGGGKCDNIMKCTSINKDIRLHVEQDLVRALITVCRRRSVALKEGGKKETFWRNTTQRGTRMNESFNTLREY